MCTRKSWYIRDWWADIQKYKNLIINKYSKFLDKKYIAALLKQVSLVEKNLEDKLQELIKNEEKSHRSR